MKRLLFLSHRIPYPPNKGDKIRSFHELKALAEDYEVDLVTFIDTKKDEHHRDDLLKYCSEAFVYHLNKIPGLIQSLLFFIRGKSLSEGYYFKKQVQKRINSLIKERNYDIVFCFSAQVAQYVLKHTHLKRIMDFVDVDSDKWFQYSYQKVFPFNIIYKMESKRLLQFEKRISESFSVSIFSTVQECEIFKNLSNIQNSIVAINNGVDSEYFKPLNVPKENSLVFVGAMDYYPNIDAVKWFVEKVFSSLIRELKDLNFLIVGSNPNSEVKNLQNITDKVMVTGFVDDIRPYMAKAKIAVMPIRIARGIQNKVLEAMAMELPVIINEKLFSSLSNLNRESVFIYKDENDLSTIIKENIANDKELAGMGKVLRNYVTEHYSWEKNLTRLKKLLTEN